MIPTTLRSWVLAGLLLVAASGLLIHACGGGGGGGGTPTQPMVSPSTVTVYVDDDFYEPKSIVIRAGDTVHWARRGNNVGHTVTERTGVFDSGFVFDQPGDGFRRTFGAQDDGKVFEYSCVTHSDCCGMRGSVRVGSDAPPPSPGY